MSGWHAALVLCLLFISVEVLAAGRPPDIAERARIEQHLGAELPLALQFRDETAKPVKLGSYFRDRPVLLVLGYYRCRNLCSTVMRSLLAGLSDLNFTAGREFEIVAVSIDPQENAEHARLRKQAYLDDYPWLGAGKGLHFLTGDEAAIRELARTAGFRYYHEPEIGQYVHAAGIMIATSDGQIARYFLGLEYPASDLRLSLVEASNQRIGSPVDYLLLLCAHYDPATGRYGPAIWNIMRLAGLATALLLAGFVIAMRLRELRGGSR